MPIEREDRRPNGALRSARDYRDLRAGGATDKKKFYEEYGFDMTPDQYKEFHKVVTDQNAEFDKYGSDLQASYEEATSGVQGNLDNVYKYTGEIPDEGYIDDYKENAARVFYEDGSGNTGFLGYTIRPKSSGGGIADPYNTHFDTGYKKGWAQPGTAVISSMNAEDRKRFGEEARVGDQILKIRDTYSEENLDFLTTDSQIQRFYEDDYNTFMKSYQEDIRDTIWKYGTVDMLAPGAGRTVTGKVLRSSLDELHSAINKSPEDVALTVGGWGLPEVGVTWYGGGFGKGLDDVMDQINTISGDLSFKTRASFDKQIESQFETMRQVYREDLATIDNILAEDEMKLQGYIDEFNTGIGVYADTYQAELDARNKAFGGLR